MRTTWTRIVAGNFGGAGLTDLLFYDRAAGTGELYTTDRSGAITLLRRHTGWRQTWSEIVPCSLAGTSRTGLLFYDRAAGEIALYTTDGSGGISLLQLHKGVRQTWTHIVPGDFASESGTQLLFYDRASGLLELRSVDGHGKLTLLERHPDWRRGWTHVIPGEFGGGRGTDLLFYDRTAGAASFYATGGAGDLTLLAEHRGWRKTWTQIVAGNLGGRDTSDLLFYERSTGTAEVYSTDGAGGITLRRGHTGWRKSSTQQYEAHYHAPGDPGRNVVIATGLDAAAAIWQKAPFNGPAWKVLTEAQAAARWNAATVRPANDPALRVFRGADLPMVTDPRPLVQQLQRLPRELVATIRLGTAQSQAIIAGGPVAARTLRNLVDVLRAQNIASALPLVTGPAEVVLVLGVIGLPGAGINLQDRRSSGFRWYALPIQGTGAELTSTGSRALFTPANAGVYAIVVVGYARSGATDPYEFRVELPPAAILDLLQYEFLMNVLDATYPAGVEVNTFSIRREHVDLDGDGSPEPLTPTVSRTYRAFRRRRHRGEFGVMLEES